MILAAFHSSSRVVIALFCSLLALPAARLLAQEPNLDSENATTIRIADVQVILIRDVSVPATVAGQISEFLVQPGDAVLKGQPLARLDATLIQREVALSELEMRIAELKLQSDSEINLAQKKLELAEERLQRLEDLRRRRPSSLSLDELQQAVLGQGESKAELTLAREKKQIASVEHEIEQESYAVASERHARHTIMAPFDGVVVEYESQEGSWVAEGKPILRLVDLGRLRLEAFVDGSRFDSSLTGSPVTFSTSVPVTHEHVDAAGSVKQQEIEVSGKVVFTSPIIQPVNGQIRIWADVENAAGKLRPGALGTLTIDVARSGVPQDTSR